MWCMKLSQYEIFIQLDPGFQDVCLDLNILCKHYIFFFNLHAKSEYFLPG